MSWWEDNQESFRESVMKASSQSEDSGEGGNHQISVILNRPERDFKSKFTATRITDGKRLGSKGGKIEKNDLASRGNLFHQINIDHPWYFNNQNKGFKRNRQMKEYLSKIILNSAQIQMGEGKNKGRWSISMSHNHVNDCYTNKVIMTYGVINLNQSEIIFYEEGLRFIDINTVLICGETSNNCPCCGCHIYNCLLYELFFLFLLLYPIFQLCLRVMLIQKIKERLLQSRKIQIAMKVSMLVMNC